VLPTYAGDVAFLPAGRVHSIGKGLLIAEIQQTSDITYRLYDFDRRDKDGKLRELHTQEALDAIDYRYYEDVKTSFAQPSGKVTTVATCPYFHTNLLSFAGPLSRNYQSIDSFIILINTEGEAELRYPGGTTTIGLGDTVLIPAALKEIELHASAGAKLLETYVPV
jgi:mannose-6-phosphate isomerase